MSSGKILEKINSHINIIKKSCVEAYAIEHAAEAIAIKQTNPHWTRVSVS